MHEKEQNKGKVNFCSLNLIMVRLFLVKHLSSDWKVWDAKSTVYSILETFISFFRLS